ncbi:hypothetical protein [Roseobacter weihaiensis]|uniref:hypothetical protein n=1 Tax=Roseobacter weihaiensis TaxID=2763262 RepID=UPI001D0A7E2A|nr:hypothetical protein [Roseobacter sp. H9]
MAISWLSPIEHADRCELSTGVDQSVGEACIDASFEPPLHRGFPDSVETSRLTTAQTENAHREQVRSLTRSVHEKNLFGDIPFSDTKFDRAFDKTLMAPERHLGLVVSLDGRLLGCCYCSLGGYFIGEGAQIVSVNTICVEPEVSGGLFVRREANMADSIGSKLTRPASDTPQLTMPLLFRFRRNLKAILVLFWILSLLSLLSPSNLAAEINNSRDIFQNSNVCSSYRSFLAKEDHDDSVICDAFTELLLSNSELGVSQFLRAVISDFEPTSAISFLAKGQLALVRGLPAEAFIWWDIADRELFHDLASSHDFERAITYSALLSGLKVSIIKSWCAAETAACSELRPYTSLIETLGPVAEGLDNYRSDFLLLCLIKTDSYRIPIREVLSSEAYLACVENP